ncbi:MAG TPA: GDP-mannose 4,6-dehydratase [Patescibacteria group bacterium]|nr:GDP-mannose 4,6-dehydratase [Patescibacteria group bacterium]
MKKALITGINGQDGSYLAELLIEKGYEVHGIIRRSSTVNIEKIDHLYSDLHDANTKLFLHYGDLTDSSNLLHLVQKIGPDEIYNLAAQSHVRISFDTPEYTADVNALGALRLLESIRMLGMVKQVKFYQASTSEMFGKAAETPQRETTVFHPRSPYGIAKLFAHWLTTHYREAYDMFSCAGILFNHESPRRGENFVTRKIVIASVNIAAGEQECLYLGNLYARRDWGYAKEYVEAMWKMLQLDQPEDFVIATGETHTVKEFIEIAFKEVGIPIVWRGSGIDEQGVNELNGKTVVRIDPYFFRPAEVDLLLGDASKAARVLNWKPQTRFEELVRLMVRAELARKAIRRESAPSSAS